MNDRRQCVQTSLVAMGAIVILPSISVHAGACGHMCAHAGTCMRMRAHAGTCGSELVCTCMSPTCGDEHRREHACMCVGMSVHMHMVLEQSIPQPIHLHRYCPNTPMGVVFSQGNTTDAVVLRNTPITVFPLSRKCCHETLGFFSKNYRNFPYL